MVYIYSDYINNRLNYTCNIIFHVVLRVPYQLVNDYEQFQLSEGVKLHYGNTKKPNAINIPSAGLLKEETIHNQENKLITGTWNDTPIIFSHPGGDIPFDIFSAVFYLITRYEEYLPFEQDEYERFTSEMSILNKINAVQLPVIDLWCIQLASKIELKSPLLENTKKQGRFLLTIDVDHAWLYKNYRPDSTIRKLARPIIYGKIKEWLQIIIVLLRFKKDPADVFRYLENIEQKIKDPIQYFILNGSGWGYDKSPFIYNPGYRRLIRKLSKRKKIGIHPSFQSNNNFKRLKKEYKQLSKVIREKIDYSRQHYLIMKFPDTYENLQKLGISADFSMGYADAIGFRAGIARPFPFFNLTTNTVTCLTVVPFMIMDVTLQKYMALSKEEAVKTIQTLNNSTMEVGGRFAVIWHNTSLAETYQWKGWRNVFEEMLKFTSKK